MLNQRPNILITNDDGIYALGIKHLWNALKDIAHVSIVAPLSEQSSVGLSTTLRQPLRVEKNRWDGHAERIWSVNGTPVDCVKLALHSILQERPNLVVSGINRGSNIGRGLLYSGTVAAAIESSMQDIPSIAFSSHDYHVEPDYQDAEKYVRHIVQYILENPMPKGTLLNVNFPQKELGPAKGFKMTHQGKEWWADDPIERAHPDEGHNYFWLGSKFLQEEGVNEGEAAWLDRGYITIVPIRVSDLTDHAHLNATKDAFESSFGGVLL